MSGKWFEFIEMAIPRPPKPVVNIPVRVLGIQKIVIVRTKRNGAL